MKINVFGYVAVLATLSWGVTLLMIIRTVRRSNYNFVDSAVEGYPLIGLGWIRITFFINLYKLYYKAKGINFLFIFSLLSLITMFVFAIVLFISGDLTIYSPRGD
jgi:hypothetical protein